MITDIDFGELKEDKNFVDTMTNLTKTLLEIDKDVTNCVENINYEKLSIEAKAKHDIYVAYTINSLYWMYVKLQGDDIGSHPIKNEISRIREVMLREKQIRDRKLRPLIDKEAAGRFIKHGIHYREDRAQNDEESQENGTYEVSEEEEVNDEEEEEVNDEEEQEVNDEEEEEVNDEEHDNYENHEMDDDEGEQEDDVNIEEINHEDNEPGRFVRIRKNVAIEMETETNENFENNFEDDDFINKNNDEDQSNKSNSEYEQTAQKTKNDRKKKLNKSIKSKALEQSSENQVEEANHSETEEDSEPAEKIIKLSNSKKFKKKKHKKFSKRKSK